MATVLVRIHDENTHVLYSPRVAPQTNSDGLRATLRFYPDESDRSRYYDVFVNDITGALRVRCSHRNMRVEVAP